MFSLERVSFLLAWLDYRSIHVQRFYAIWRVIFNGEIRGNFDGAELFDSSNVIRGRAVQVTATPYSKDKGKGIKDETITCP